MPFCSDSADGFYADCDEDLFCTLAGNAEDFCETGNTDDERCPSFVFSFLIHFFECVVKKWNPFRDLYTPEKFQIRPIDAQSTRVALSMAIVVSDDAPHNIAHLHYVKHFFQKNSKNFKKRLFMRVAGRLFIDCMVDFGF